MKIRPLQDRVLVKRLDESEEKTKGGIIIPDTAKEKPQQGKVVAVGKGKVNDDGKLTPLDVKVGRHHPVRQILPAPRSNSTESSTSSCARRTSSAWSRAEKELKQWQPRS